MKQIAAIVMCGVWSCTALAQYTVEILHNERWPQSGCFGARLGQQAGVIGNYWFRAMLWRGASQAPIHLHDPSWYSSAALATDGVRQAGHRTIGAPGTQRVYATMWSGSAQSWVNLNPQGNEISIAYGIAGEVQVGMIKPLSASHITYAVLWRNTAESATLLHPPGWETSEAYATDGKQHVGFVKRTETQGRAAVWQDTGRRFVDLNPYGYHLSYASGVSNGQQVGTAAFEGNGGSGFGVWSRPSSGGGGSFHQAVSATVPDIAAVLRSRRD